MASLEKETLTAVFKNINNILKSKSTDLNESYESIRFAKYYFSKGLESLDSFEDPDESKGIIVIPYLSYAGVYLGYGPDLKLSEIKDIRAEFKHILLSLDKLEKYPEMVYESEDYEIISKHFSNLAEGFNKSLKSR